MGDVGSEAIARMIFKEFDEDRGTNDEDKTTTVEIADHNGHTVAQMTRDETIAVSSGNRAWSS